MSLPVSNAPPLPRIHGYHLQERLYEGRDTAVYRGLDETSLDSMVVKLLKVSYPNVHPFVKCRSQYLIAKNLDCPGIVRVLKSARWQNPYAVVMEDGESIALSRYLKDVAPVARLTVGEVFAIATPEETQPSTEPQADNPNLPVQLIQDVKIFKRSKTLSTQDQSGVSVIYQCGTHLLNVINDVWDISKIEAKKLDLHAIQTHLPSLLQGVVAMCRVKAEEKGLDFIERFSTRLPTQEHLLKLAQQNNIKDLGDKLEQLVSGKSDDALFIKPLQGLAQQLEADAEDHLHQYLLGGDD